MSVSIIEKAIGKLGESTAEVPRASIIADAAAAAQKIAVPENHASPASRGIPQVSAASPVPEAPARAVSKRAEIDLARLHGLGMVTPDGNRTSIAEEFRLIKRPLIEKAFEQTSGVASNHRNLIMVTSSLPGEGKTFCAVNLAISIAMEMDHTVLLIDADVARPTIPYFLGLQNEAGLMDVLLDDKLDLADVLLKTNIDSLSFLPAGKSHRHATELLASQSMSRLLDEIAKRYPDRIVIFDSPPVLLTTESRVLASQMGQIVMVVEAEKTTQHAVKSVLRQLGSSANVNLIYNKSRGFSGEEYYGRYYN